MAEKKLSLKLLIDKAANKVVMAETEKDFVDFLFNLLSLPIASISMILNNASIVGCITNLYNSVKELNGTYMQTKQSKDTLLKLRSPTLVNGVVDFLPGTREEPPVEKQLYICRNSHWCVTEKMNTTCKQCSFPMCNKVDIVCSENDAKTISKNGYVKGVVKYMVMDDLSVKPLSIMPGLDLLNKCGIKDLNVIEEKKVQFGVDEALKLLRASLNSKTALTDVFLSKEKASMSSKTAQTNGASAKEEAIGGKLFMRI